MPELVLHGCGATPLGAYLKALAVLRLVSDQVDSTAQAHWSGDHFHLNSLLDRDGLLRFFLETYQPTPIVAPWNGGSGFFPKDNSEALNAIATCSSAQFAPYRETIIAARLKPFGLCHCASTRSCSGWRRSKPR